MYNEDDSKLNSFAIVSCCNECSLPLAEYGYNSIIICNNSDSLTENYRELCGKCVADFFGDDDYSEKIEANYENIIIVEPTQRGSRARIRGMQTTVYDVLKSLATGMTEKDIFKKIPGLTPQHILACLAFAADREKGIL